MRKSLKSSFLTKRPNIHNTYSILYSLLYSSRRTAGNERPCETLLARARGRSGGAASRQPPSASDSSVTATGFCRHFNCAPGSLCSPALMTQRGDPSTRKGVTGAGRSARQRGPAHVRPTGQSHGNFSLPIPQCVCRQRLTRGVKLRQLAEDTFNEE